MLSFAFRCSLAAIVSLASMSVVAHHGPWTYDWDQIVTFRGKVTEVRWNYPHVEILLEGMDEAGEAVEWRLESEQPHILARMDLAPSDLGLNSEVVYTGNPAREPGRFAAYARSVLVAGGVVLELPELGAFGSRP